MKKFDQIKNQFKLLLVAVALLCCYSCQEQEILPNEDGFSYQAGRVASAPTVGNTYYIKSRKSGRYIDVAAYSHANGGKLHQWNWHGQANQQWQVISTGNGYYRLKSVESGKSFDITNASTANRAYLQQWAYGGATNQQFTFHSVGGDYYMIKVRHSGKGLDGTGQTPNGSRIWQWSYNTSNQNQHWVFENVNQSGGGGGGGTGNANYPSDLMENYNQWKITYPDGSEDKTLYQESNEYFEVNSSKNGIVFYAPIRSDNGTTPNSSYVRSELRERKADGSSDIYWTTSGTHVVYVKQAITHLPINKSHLVATQIHGNKDEGIDDAMVLRLEDKHLFLSFNGGKLRSDLTIKTNYNLGTVHEVIFEVINGKHYCYYSEDGNLKSSYESGNASGYLVKDGSNSYVMNKSYGDAYFKVGNYTQSNPDQEGSDTDDPDNYGEVVVYDFYVRH